MNLINEIDGAGLEYQAMARLEEFLGRVPFIRLSPRRRSSRSDGTIEAEVAGRRWLILVETRKLGQPREVRSALLRLQGQLEKADAKHRYGVLVSPFFSEESARLCVEAGVGYADLAGNARLSFDHVFIETHAADNPFRVKRNHRSLFSAKAGRLLRVLLTPPLRAWKVADLAASAGVSLGQVSNVRKLLLDREWAALMEGGLRLSRPEALARAWQGSYEMRERSRASAYTLLHGEALQVAIRRALAEAGNGSHAVLASYSAAQWLAPYARQATQFFYADGVGCGILERVLQLQPVKGGENVVVFEPREDDVFGGRIEAAPGMWSSGLVQTWLDLSVAGERGAEAAEHLLNERLLPTWQAASL
jgi:hypothetical protein